MRRRRSKSMANERRKEEREGMAARRIDHSEERVLRSKHRRAAATVRIPSLYLSLSVLIDGA